MMFKRFLALAISALMLASCVGPVSSAPASSEPVDDEEESSAAPLEISETLDPDLYLKDGKLQFQQIGEPLFTMDYEPVTGTKTKQHFGLNFYDGFDTDWLGDNGNVASFNIYRRADMSPSGEKEVFGNVTITSAPIDMQAAFGTSDPAEIAEKMAPNYFTVENYYTGYKKNLVEDFQYEIAADMFGEAFEGWNAFYVEFINEQDANHGIRFYMCNDEINENFLSFMVSLDVPADDLEAVQMLRNIVLTMHLRAE